MEACEVPSRCRAVGVLVPHQASCLHPPLSVVVACVKCHWCGGPCIPDLHLPREMHGNYWGVNVPNTALVTSQIFREFRIENLHLEETLDTILRRSMYYAIRMKSA